jgi:predicted secreted hydrolase
MVLALLATLAPPAIVVADSHGAAPAANPIERVLSAPAQGFSRAFAPRELEFPEDHGAHPDFRSEWWYFTGNVESSTGRRFGFQLTFFRFALSPEDTPRASAWGSNQVYMAHFALSDQKAGAFHAFERYSRAALELAGARAAPFRVWLGDWRAEGGENAMFPLRLRAAENGYAVSLAAERGKPFVLQGDAGLSQKSAEPGNASYYYSLTRMPVDGTIVTPAGEFRVRGAAWLDREWSTTALADGQVGWDWFALQLSDGRDLMVYRLRRSDGSVDPHSSGTLVESDGTHRVLAADEFELQVLDHWRSPRDGAEYPARWRLHVPSAAIHVEITPELADQELDLAFRYWEGASRVAGRSQGRAVSGRGYVELVGYSTPP